jgi:hypothetical protein
MFNPFAKTPEIVSGNLPLPTTPLPDDDLTARLYDDLETLTASGDRPAPPVDPDHKFSVAKGVLGGTSTLAGLALALLLSSAPALANACPGRVVNTDSHSLCLRSTDKGEPRVDVMGTQVSMVRFVGGMLTMSGPYTRTVPDDRRLPIIFNSKTGVGAIAEAGSFVRAIEGNAAARKHLRIQ